MKMSDAIAVMTASPYAVFLAPVLAYLAWLAAAWLFGDPNAAESRRRVEEAMGRERRKAAQRRRKEEPSHAD